MANQLEARISAIKNIYEKFGHDIREMKEQLVRLTQSVEDRTRIMAMNSQGLSSYLVQPTPHTFPHHPYPSHQPHLSTANNTLWEFTLLTHNPRGSLQMPL